ncbi:hypothetical protein SAMN05518672_103196 [Chitinophaga sp. CF118]|uniref:hypothetical protein n=1 Tax=Chitinophaga sp. CF118 TaxID=1884367 RepID=UPI0008E48A98|nr:hypothetical protein [Chitinophaga sp. CF118]SFD78228.1 hypothetical protein SAMN05518672_103196 [Chitinophaga sp. CF118]
MYPVPDSSLLPASGNDYIDSNIYQSGDVKVICSKRIIDSGISDIPDHKVFLSFYQSEYAYAFNLVIYGYFPDNYVPDNPVFDTELVNREVTTGDGGAPTTLLTRVLSLNYPSTQEQQATYSLWEINVTYAVFFSDFAPMEKAEAILLNLITNGKLVESSVFTIPKRIYPFFLGDRQVLDATSEIVHTGMQFPPLEPLVIFNNPVADNEINLTIYAFLPAEYEPSTVTLIPAVGTPAIVLPIEGEDPSNNIKVAIRTISITYATAALFPSKRFGEYSVWKIQTSYTDPTAQLVRVCYSIGDPVTTRGTVTSVQRS